MKQYHQHLQKILDYGTWKEAARPGMPRTLSLFGYQFEHNLSDGFPLLTSKKMYWKGVVAELLWFLNGDTNIKTLIDQGVNIWNGDAYNWYKKTVNRLSNERVEPPFDLLLDDPNTNSLRLLTEAEFVDWIKCGQLPSDGGYVLGDCGYQYGKVWTDWQSTGLNQIERVINSLKSDPTGRRHIVTAVDPINDQNLALYWCHSLFQFNCRPLSFEDKLQWVMKNTDVELENLAITERAYADDVPNWYLDCQLYQRSADAFLGEPFNIASYALLTHIIARICGMIPGKFIHSFGDSHLYENHIEAAKEQLSREFRPLPKLDFSEEFNKAIAALKDGIDLKDLFKHLTVNDFIIKNYNPHPAIVAKLSTGI